MNRKPQRVWLFPRKYNIKECFVLRRCKGDICKKQHYYHGMKLLNTSI